MEENIENLMPFSLNEENDILISARDIHEFLNVKTSFRLWFPRMTEYGFEEEEDYYKVYERVSTSGGSQTVVDYMISIDMAKEIAMIQRSPEGKTARKYFISIEKKFKSAQRAISTLLEMTQNNLKNTNQRKSQEYIVEEKTINSGTNFRDTAKILGVRENLLVNWLLINKYCYRDKHGKIKPYAKFMEFFAMKDFSTDYGHRGTQTLINKKGREAFKRYLTNENIIKNNEVKLLE